MTVFLLLVMYINWSWRWRSIAVFSIVLNTSRQKLLAGDNYPLMYNSEEQMALSLNSWFSTPVFLHFVLKVAHRICIFTFWNKFRLNYTKVNSVNFSRTCWSVHLVICRKKFQSLNVAFMLRHRKKTNVVLGNYPFKWCSCIVKYLFSRLFWSFILPIITKFATCFLLTFPNYNFIVT